MSPNVKCAVLHEPLGADRRRDDLGKYRDLTPVELKRLCPLSVGSWYFVLQTSTPRTFQHAPPPHVPAARLVPPASDRADTVPHADIDRTGRRSNRLGVRVGQA